MNTITTENSVRNVEKLFCDLYVTYKSRLVYFAMRFLKSRDIAEDVVQDVFVSIWQNRRNLDTGLSVESYLFTTMHNRILNQLKNIDNEIRLKEALVQSAVDSACETRDPAIEQDFETVFERMLCTLTPQQRRVFTLKREGKLSHKEIASLLGISVYTVNQHITEAMRTLRAQLAKNPDLYVDCLLLFLLCQR